MLWVVVGVVGVPLRPPRDLPRDVSSLAVITRPTAGCLLPACLDTGSVDDDG